MGSSHACKIGHVGLPLQIRMQDTKVTLGEWPSGSWDITVALKALLVADTRLQGGDAPIYVVQIGDVEGLSPATIARLASRLRTRSSNMTSPEHSTARWAKVGFSVVTRARVLPFSRSSSTNFDSAEYKRTLMSFRA